MQEGTDVVGNRCRFLLKAFYTNDLPVTSGIP